VSGKIGATPQTPENDPMFKKIEDNIAKRAFGNNIVFASAKFI
jgi:hypothetical protein